MKRRKRGDRLAELEKAARNGPEPRSHATGVIRGAEDEEPWQEPLPLGEFPEAAAFPITVLPRPLVRFVEEVAWTLNCPTDFAAVPLLAIAGGAIGNSRRLAIHESHHQSACLFAGVVGDPGSGKSPALEMVRQPLDEVDREHYRDWKPQREAWDDTPAKGRGPAPVLKRLVLEDATMEAVAQVLSENPRGATMIRDELAALVAGLNQYKNGHGADRKVILKLWGHATIQVDRKGNHDKGPISVYRPFLSIVGGIQPAVVETLRGEPRRGVPPPDDGFLDRWLISYPASLPAKKEEWRTLSTEAADGWREILKDLLHLSMIEEGGEQRPKAVTLTSDGRAAWVAFTEAHARELNSEDFCPHLRGAWQKLRGYCGRLALIVHQVRLAAGERVGNDVDGESLTRAAQLVAYFKSHTKKVYVIMDADPKVADARHILRHLEGQHNVQTFTRAEVYRHLRRYFKDCPDNLDAPLKLLVEHRYLRVSTDPQNRPGPRTETYSINPQWERSRITRITRDDPDEG